MILNVESLKARWVRLQHYDRAAHTLARKADHDDIWAKYSERLDRVRALRVAILGRYTRLKAADAPDVVDKTITWSPSDELETYDAESIVLTGQVPDYVRLTSKAFRDIARWQPLADASGDSESGQGFIYASAVRAPEVVERLAVLGLKAVVRDSVDGASPPRNWRVTSAWPPQREPAPVVRPLGVVPELVTE